MYCVSLWLRHQKRLTSQQRILTPANANPSNSHLELPRTQLLHELPLIQIGILKQRHPAPQRVPMLKDILDIMNKQIYIIRKKTYIYTYIYNKYIICTYGPIIRRVICVPHPFPNSQNNKSRCSLSHIEWTCIYIISMSNLNATLTIKYPYPMITPE